MGRGIESQALAASGQNANAAQSALSGISPIYSNFLSGTSGLTPQQKANLLTSGAQSVGGSVAGAVGQGNLAAARTNNAGGYTAALDDAASRGIAQNSDIALGVQNEDAQIARDNQRIGLQGLSNIYQGASGRQIQGLNTANDASAQTQNAIMGWTRLGLQAASGGFGG